MKQVISLFFLLFFIISCQKDAVNKDPNWTIYTTEDGLLDASVYSIECDLNGKVFVGHSGKNSGISTIENGNIQTYPVGDNSVRDLRLDHQGNMWAGVYQKDLMKFENDTWIVPNEDISNVTHITRGLNNVLWMCTDDTRLIKYDGTNWTIDRIPDSIVRGEGRLICSTEDNNGKLWVGSRGGLYSLQGNVWEVYDLIPEEYKEHVECMLLANNGDLYVSIYYRGVKKFDGTSWTNVEGLPHEWITSMYQSTNGDIWYGTAYAGVAQFNGTEIIHYDDDFLKTHYVIDICQSTDGSMWFSNGKAMQLSNWD